MFATYNTWSWSQCGMALVCEFAAAALFGLLFTIAHNCCGYGAGSPTYSEQQPVVDKYINGEYQGYQL